MRAFGLSSVVAASVALVFLFGTFGGPVRAQNASVPVTDKPELVEARRLSQESVRLLSQGDAKSALPPAKQALAGFEKAAGPDDPQTLTAAYNLAVIQGRLGEYWEVMKLNRRVISGNEKLYGKNSPKLCKYLISLGWSCYTQALFPEAESSFTRALKIRETSAPGDDTQAIDELFALGMYFQKRGLPEKSLPHLHRFLAAQEKISGDTSKDYGSALRICGCAELQEIGNRKDVKSDEYKGAEERMRRGQELLLGNDASPKIKVPATVLTQTVTRGKAINRVTPEYPRAALALRIQGIVIVEVLIDEKGNVMKSEVLCGVDLLSNAALKAARDWKFQPTLLDGQPVKVTGAITFKFNHGR